MNCEDSNEDDLWNTAMTQSSQVNTNAIASQVDNLQLANMEVDECHPDDNPKSPKGYDSDEDTRDYEQFQQSILYGQDNSEDEGGQDQEKDYYCDLLVYASESEDDSIPVPKYFSVLDYPELVDLVGGDIPTEQEENNGPEMNTMPDIINGQWYTDFQEVYGVDEAEAEPLFPEAEEVGNVLDPGHLEVGLEFPDKAGFCNHLRAYALVHGFEYKVKKSCSERVIAICAESETTNCQFYVYAKKEKGEHTFTIRGLNLTHSYQGNPLGRNNSANPAFLDAHLMQKLAGGDVIPKATEIADEFWASHNTLLPYHTAWRSRVMVLEQLHSSYDDRYKRVPSLCEMISRTNPGSITNYTYGRNDRKFESVMISFAAPLQGFKDGCRPIIGLDVCHLKGKYGGALLAATALDAQNGLVPLGIFICRNECYENWYLFLKNLKPKVIGHHLNLNFISDRQKGLVDAVKKVFPKSPHRFYFRHLFKNFKTHFKGSKLKEHLWNAAKTYKVEHFKVHMNNLLEESNDAVEYIMQEHPSTWARSFYDEQACCEHMNNNFSESFNNMISKLRDKHVCKIGLMYGKLFMGLFFKRRNEASTWEEGDLVPAAKKLLKKMLKNTGSFKVERAQLGKLYLVTSVHKSIFTVNIVDKTCTCMQWQLRGFPCQHAVCALKLIRPNWTQYCSHFYSTDSYKATYAPPFFPLQDPEDWVEQADPQNPILPPQYMRKPGRPRVNKRRSHLEPTTEKKARSCTRCKQPVHNVKTCQGGPVGSNPNRKRARTEVDGATHQPTSYHQGECSTGRTKSTRSRSGGGFFRQAFTDTEARSTRFNGAGTSASGSSRATRSQGFFRQVFADAEGRTSKKANTTKK